MSNGLDYRTIGIWLLEWLDGSHNWLIGSDDCSIGLGSWIGPLDWIIGISGYWIGLLYSCIGVSEWILGLVSWTVFLDDYIIALDYWMGLLVWILGWNHDSWIWDSWILG